MFSEQLLACMKEKDNIGTVIMRVKELNFELLEKSSVIRRKITWVFIEFRTEI